MIKVQGKVSKVGSYWELTVSVPVTAGTVNIGCEIPLGHIYGWPLRFAMESCANLATCYVKQEVCISALGNTLVVSPDGTVKTIETDGK